MSENIGILSTPDGTGANIKTLQLQNESLSLLINNQAKIQTNVTNLYKSIEILSDTDTWDTTGSAICLRSKYAESVDKGTFQILASDGESRITLVGWPNKNLTWDNKFIDTIYSSGSNYIQYTNGLLICFDNVDLVSTNGTEISQIINFPIAFTYVGSIITNVNSHHCITTAYNLTTTGFAYRVVSIDNYNITSLDGRYIAIGYWK